MTTGTAEECPARAWGSYYRSLGADLASVTPPAWPDAGLVAIIKILLTSVVVDLLREIPSWAAAQAFANRRTTPCTTPPTPWPPGFTSTARRS
jgi:hypothetical protein